MRLIDADALLSEFLRRYTEREKNGKSVFAACEIKQDFADMITDAPTIEAEPKWIPVTERLPEWMEYVIVHYENGFIRIAMLVDDHRFSHTGLYGPVTHWMPLPAPPAMD